MLGGRTASAGTGVEEACRNTGGREEGAYFSASREELPAASARSQPFAGECFFSFRTVGHAHTHSVFVRATPAPLSVPMSSVLGTVAVI